jgi:hypothetical protein
MAYPSSPEVHKLTSTGTIKADNYLTRYNKAETDLGMLAGTTD